MEFHIIFCFSLPQFKYKNTKLSQIGNLFVNKYSANKYYGRSTNKQSGTVLFCSFCQTDKTEPSLVAQADSPNKQSIAIQMITKSIRNFCGISFGTFAVFCPELLR